MPIPEFNENKAPAVEHWMPNNCDIHRAPSHVASSSHDDRIHPMVDQDRLDPIAIVKSISLGKLKPFSSNLRPPILNNFNFK